MLLPIVGLVYGGILGAMAIWFAWSADLMQCLGIWMLGEFSGVMMGRYEWRWAVAVLAVVLYAVADRITLLGLGERQARSLGLDYAHTRALRLAIVAALTALVLVTVEAFPFVRLLAPNLVSRWRGDNLRANLPFVALLGGVLMETLLVATFWGAGWRRSRACCVLALRHWRWSVRRQCCSGCFCGKARQT